MLLTDEELYKEIIIHDEILFYNIYVCSYFLFGVIQQDFRMKILWQYLRH